MLNFLKEPKIKVRTAIYGWPNSNACCWEWLKNWVKLYCMFKGTWVHAYWHIDLIIKPCFNKNLKIKDCKNILFIVRLIKFIWISFVFFLSLFSFSYQYLPFFYFLFPAESIGVRERSNFMQPKCNLNIGWNDAFWHLFSFWLNMIDGTLLNSLNWK